LNLSLKQKAHTLILAKQKNLVLLSLLVRDILREIEKRLEGKLGEK